jgi:hypothetical protein
MSWRQPREFMLVKKEVSEDERTYSRDTSHEEVG